MTDRRFWTLGVARIVLYAPFMSVAACIPALTEEWGIGAGRAGLILSGFYAAYAVSLFVFSWIADHIGARRSAIISTLASAAASAVFALFARDYWNVLFLYSLMGLSLGGLYTPLVMLVHENTRPERRGTMMGWLIGSTSIGYASSLALSGIGIAVGGWQAAFLLTGLLPSVGAVALIWSLKSVPNRIYPRSRDSGLWRQLRSNRQARLLIGGYTAHSWEALGGWSWTPALIAASFAVSGAPGAFATQSGAYVAAGMHLVGATAAFSMGKLSDRLGRRTVLLGIAAISAVLSLLIGWAVALPPLVFSMLAMIYAFFTIGDSPVLSTALAERVDPASLGAVLAVRSLLGFGAGALATPVAGAAMDVLRSHGAAAASIWGAGFAIMGVGGVLAALAAYKLAR